MEVFFFRKVPELPSFVINKLLATQQLGFFARRRVSGKSWPRRRSHSMASDRVASSEGPADPPPDHRFVDALFIGYDIFISTHRKISAIYSLTPRRYVQAADVSVDLYSIFNEDTAEGQLPLSPPPLPRCTSRPPPAPRPSSARASSVGPFSRSYSDVSQTPRVPLNRWWALVYIRCLFYIVN